MSGTFVSVGNAKQPFSRLLDMVAAIGARLPEPVLVQHGHTAFMHSTFNIVPFMDMDKFAEAVAKADVLILHAGAGSVIHAVRAGKTPIVVPRRAALHEHIDDHQMEFAKVLDQAGKIFFAENAEQIIDAMKKIKKGGTPEAVQPAMVNLVKQELDKLAAQYH